MKLSPELKQAQQIKITLVRSGIGRPMKHKLVLKGLGLRKLNHSVVRPNIPQIWGMINKVPHLVKLEPVEKTGKVSTKPKAKSKPQAADKAKV
jgi:large subunit ribosomal protein L30